MKRELIISRTHWQAILAYVQEHAPLEACGLLAGQDGRVEEVIFVRNQARSPARFVMNPYEQLKAFDRIESHGWDLLGIFHSHPAGPEGASATDIAEAAYEVIHVILSRKQKDWQAHGFWIEDGTATEVPLQIVE